MKLAWIGIITMIVSLAFAAGLVENPIASQMSTDEKNYYMPVAKYADGDTADDISHSDWNHVSNDTFFVEWTYIWAEEEDSESVRVFVRNGSVVKLQFYVINKWMDVEQFPVEEGHPVVKFMKGSHNPYVTRTNYMSNIFKSSLPFLVPFLFGVLLVLIDLKVIEMFARYNIAKGVITGGKKKK